MQIAAGMQTLVSGEPKRRLPAKANRDQHASQHDTRSSPGIPIVADSSVHHGYINVTQHHFGKQANVRGPLGSQGATRTISTSARRVNSIHAAACRANKPNERWRPSPYPPRYLYKLLFIIRLLQFDNYSHYFTRTTRHLARQLVTTKHAYVPVLPASNHTSRSRPRNAMGHRK